MLFTIVMNGKDFCAQWEAADYESAFSIFHGACTIAEQTGDFVCIYDNATGEILVDNSDEE